MRELLVCLGLITCPALVFGIFGASGLDAFDETKAARPQQIAMGQGRHAFVRACAECHGRMGEGTDQAPGLIAAESRARAMPDDVIEEALLNDQTHRTVFHGAAMKIRPAGHDLASVLRYLREVQRITGINRGR